MVAAIRITRLRPLVHARMVYLRLLFVQSEFDDFAGRILVVEGRMECLNDLDLESERYLASC